MGTLSSLVKTAEALSIYCPEEGTLIYAELAALAEGIDIVNNSLQELERECFVSTSESYGLDFRETISGTSRRTFSLESRRAMLIYRMGVTASDFTRGSMERAMVSCGIKASVIEYPEENRLYVGVIEILDDGLTQEKIKSYAMEFLPLHLDITFDFRRFSWELAEAKQLTFGEMDSKAMTWEKIDKYEEE